MRSSFVLTLLLVVGLPGFCQPPAGDLPSLPKDPREIFAVAAPFYDFKSPDLKPWHLKATYQLYDEKGKPAEQGIFEYWWVSPKVYRTSWTRPGASRTDWYAPDDRQEYLTSGDPISLFEYKIESALFSVLPGAGEIDPAKYRLDRQTIRGGGVKFPCIEVIPNMPQHGRIQDVPIGWFPTYCFDPKIPILRVSFSLGRMTTEFDTIVKVQNRFLPRQLVVSEGKNKVLTVNVNEINGIPPDDPALVPASDAHEANRGKVEIEGKVMVGKLINKQAPDYPQDAKEAHVEGIVVLDATIGMDGQIHDLNVESAPWPSLAASALWAVAHWKYQPYLLNGKPVEVKTTIKVIYALGR